jgi:hypothetical protein
VVAMIGAGIGANTAMFSLLRAYHYHSAPYPDADRLVLVSTVMGGQEQDVNWVPPADFAAIRSDLRTLDATTAVNASGLTIRMNGVPERHYGTALAGPMFQQLGTTAAIGRLLTAEDERPGAKPVAVLPEHAGCAPGRRGVIVVGGADSRYWAAVWRRAGALCRSSRCGCTVAGGQSRHGLKIRPSKRRGRRADGARDGAVGWSHPAGANHREARVGTTGLSRGRPDACPPGVESRPRAKRRPAKAVRRRSSGPLPPFVRGGLHPRWRVGCRWADHTNGYSIGEAIRHRRTRVLDPAPSCVSSLPDTSRRLALRSCVIAPSTSGMRKEQFGR